MAEWKEKVYINGVMETIIMEVITMEWKVGKVKCSGKCPINIIKDIGKMVSLLLLLYKKINPVQSSTINKSILNNNSNNINDYLLQYNVFKGQKISG